MCLSLQFCIAFRRVPNALNFHLGILRDIFLAGLGILDQRVDYFLFVLQLRALSVTVNSQRAEKQRQILLQRVTNMVFKKNDPQRACGFQDRIALYSVSISALQAPTTILEIMQGCQFC